MDDTAGRQGAVTVVHDEDRDRFEALRGEQVIGVLQYGDEPPDGSTTAAGLRDLRSTVVAPEHGGRGVGSALVRRALEDAREKDLRVRATCWFARGWIARHPEFSDLLHPDQETA